MKSIWETNGGIYIGHPVNGTNGPPKLRSAIVYNRDRHICWLGNSGAGKSRRLLLPNLAWLTGWSILMVDVKGELMKMCSGWRYAHGTEEIVLNPFGLFNVPSRGYNPLGSLDPTSDEFPDDVMEQVEGIVEISTHGETHWDTSAQDVLAGITMYVRLAIPGGTYRDVRALLAQPDEALRTMIGADAFDYRGETYPGMMVAGEKYGWPEIGYKMARFSEINSDSRELHSILSHALTQTRFIDSRAMQHELAGGMVDFAAMKQRPMTVWLALPDRRLGTHAKWLRLVLTSVIQALMNEARPGRVPVAIVLDDAAAMGHLPIIENTVAQMRGYGIKLITVWQGLDQIKAIYRDRWESFIGNAGVFQSFSMQDAFSSEYISRLAGVTTRQQEQRSINQSLNTRSAASYNTSSTISSFQVPLMLPQDVRNMEDGYTLAFSHVLGGATRCYLPYPTTIDGLQPICALDPTQ